MKTKYLIILLITIALVISCSDDENPTSPEEKNAKELNIKEITMPSPMQQSSNTYAQYANAYVNLANSFRGFSAFYSPPNKTRALAKVNEEWSSTWAVDALDVTMNYYDNTSVFGWTIRLDGTDGEFNYNNWLFMEAEENTTTNSGYLKKYKPVTDMLEFEWAYSNSLAGVYSFILMMYEEGDGSEKIDIISNLDNSGELTYFQTFNDQFVPETKIAWTAAGTGEWWEYDLDGNITDTGTF